MIVALKIQFDATTGYRAGNIDPKDPHLRARGRRWQFLNGSESYEIREVLDDRDVSVYESVEGITVLKGSKAINLALQELERQNPNNYIIERDVVLAALQNGDHPEWGDMELLVGHTLKDRASDLWNRGTPGIRKVRHSIPKV